MIDYKQYNLKSFKTFVDQILVKKFRGKMNYSEVKDKVDQILAKETARLTALSFYKTLNVLGEGLDEASAIFFKDLPSKKLESLAPSTNKLQSLLGSHFNSKAEVAKASGIAESTLNELFKNKFERMYAYEAIALAIAFGITPSSLFEYLYGDGERPLVGL